MDAGKWMRQTINKIKGGKIKKDQIFIFFLAGVLLLVIALPSGKKDEEESQESSSAGIRRSREDESEDAYVTRMEKRLEEILSQVDGAGEVSVMITLKSSSEKVVEKDVQAEKENVTETDSQGGNRVTTSSNHSESTIYDGESTNGQTPYISKELSPEVEGVVVIAQGGDDAVVVKNITDAIQALFGIDTHKIRIMKGRRANQ